MANFVRAESVVRDAVNFCADSDVIEVSIHARGPIQWVKKPFETPLEISYTGKTPKMGHVTESN